MKPTHLIAVDIGNTCTDVGFFIGDRLEQKETYPSDSTGMDQLCQQSQAWKQDSQVIIASVVPSLSDYLSTGMETAVSQKPIIVDSFKTELLPLKIDMPNTVGVDRVVNCYAAIHLYGCPAIVFSLGTATTVEVISSQGEYLGGAIAPGAQIALESLTQRTALLPPVRISQPQRLIGTNTMEHMVSGVYYGTIGLIEGFIKRIRQEIGGEATVIGTGGISTLMEREHLFDVLEPNLTLKGLQLIYSKFVK